MGRVRRRSFGLPPAATEVSRVTTQSIGNGIDDPVIFTAEVRDELGAWSAGAPTRLTAPTTGNYEASGWMARANNSTFKVQVAIRVNGATTVARRSNQIDTQGSTNLAVQRALKLAAGDYVEFVVWFSGTVRTVDEAWFSLVRIA